MRTKMQIKEQRVFAKKVFKCLEELGVLQKFVAAKIHISSARLSQFLGNFRQMPPKIKEDLTTFLKMEGKKE